MAREAVGRGRDQTSIERNGGEVILKVLGILVVSAAFYLLLVFVYNPSGVTAKRIFCRAQTVDWLVGSGDASVFEFGVLRSESFMSADVGNLEELGSRACVLATFGRHREAIELINTALWRYPADKRLYNNRCCSYIQTFDFENALADAEYLTENFPDFAKGYIRKGEVLTLMRKYSKAEKEYRTALDLTEDEAIHIRCLQLQLLQIVSCGFDPYSAWKALCETGSVQQSLRLLKTPYRNYEHVVNANFYGDTYFKHIEEGSTFSEEDEDDEEDDEGLYDLGSIESLPDLMKKLEIKIKEVVKVDEKPIKERRQKENVFGGKKIRKKFPNKQDKTKKIIRRNKKKLLFVKTDDKTDNVLTIRNK